MSDFDIPGRVDLSIKEAQWLADLHGIDNDLRDVVKLCSKCLEWMQALGSPKDNPTDWLDKIWLSGEMSFAAVVKYGRTFGSGVRNSIPSSWIARLTPEYQVKHQYFKDLRDKFIAHSVNAFEDNQVFAYLHPQLEPRGVQSITVDTGRYVSMSSSDVSSLKQLAETLQQIARYESTLEMSRVLEIARSMPLPELLKRSTESRPIPSNDDVAKPRPKT
jgi:hypothetical protein